MSNDRAFEIAWDALSKAWYDEEDADPYKRQENPESWERENKMPDEDDPFWDEIGEDDGPRPKTLGTKGKESINAILNLLGLRRSKQ
tara:strand:- start:430 stop:690 length:261 start_codon:yes stop_codon:yes gene_type:complete